MVETGTVRARGANGMVAIETEGGGFTVVEPLGSERLEPGDVVRGDLRTHGSTTLRMAESGEPLRVFVQAVDATSTNARTLLGLR